MYFALLCCPLRMTKVLHLPSGSIVFQSESHNVVKFIQLEICGCFPFPFFLFLYVAILSSSLLGITPPQLEKLLTCPLP